VSSWELWTFNHRNEAHLFGEAHNAFLGCIHIWTEMCYTYGLLDRDDPATKARAMQADDDGPFERLWGRWLRLPVQEQWILGMTFDHVIVRAHAIPTLVEHLHAWMHAGPPSRHTSTIQRMCEMLVEAHGITNVTAVAWNATSVGTALWAAVPVDPGKDDTEYRPFVLGRDQPPDGKPAWYLDVLLQGQGRVMVPEVQTATTRTHGSRR
jgi:hypothetical protein